MIESPIDKLAKDIECQVLKNASQEYTLGKIVGVCIDGRKMFDSPSEFIAKIKKKTPNAVGSHCVFHRQALSSKTSLIAMKDNLQRSYEPSTTLKVSDVNTKLFTKLCKDMDYKHKNLLFHTSFRWL